MSSEVCSQSALSESVEEQSPAALKGVEVIREALKTMPLLPGVYRMLGAKGEVLYVGKALALKKRVVSYTHIGRLPERLRRMVSETVAMEIVTTHTEAEALLLEANYIKRMKPRFNILLRDDKSYPWLMITGNHAFPQITKYRGKTVKGADLWGPFASAWAVNQTLNLLQRAFLLRSCSDSDFNSRSRPCLLHQIKRCSAPCAGRIDEAHYALLVRQAHDFLSGKDVTLREEISSQMLQASEELDFERAAVLRDRVRALAQMQDSQVINPHSLEEADVMGVWQEGGLTCIQVFFVRGGRNNGSRSFFPVHVQEQNAEDVLSAFIVQFYEDKSPPRQILVSSTLAEAALLEEALSLQKGRKVEIFNPQRGEKKQVLDHAVTNARDALRRRQAESAGQARLLEGVAAVFDMKSTPQRIEVYDNSHIMGAHAYGVMIVGGPEGFDRRAYRKFLIKGPVTPGDDFAMMREVLERRFGRALKEAEDGDRSNWPDLLLIDGGAGQYSAVRAVLDDLGVTGVTLVGIAKGPDRDAGREWFYTKEKEPFQLDLRDPVLYYLQRLRDEAHRFAITTHRAGRSKALVRSELDDIPGVGSGRKKALLNVFGSVRAIRQAGIAELESVPGISIEMAGAIYGYFHPGWKPV